MEEEFALPAQLGQGFGRRAIDVETGDEEGLRVYFIPKESLSELRFQLMNVENEAQLADFLSRCGYVPLESPRGLPELRKEIAFRKTDWCATWYPSRHVTPALWQAWI